MKLLWWFFGAIFSGLIGFSIVRAWVNHSDNNDHDAIYWCILTVGFVFCRTFIMYVEIKNEIYKKTK